MTREPGTHSKGERTASRSEPVVAVYRKHLRERSPAELDARVLQSARRAVEGEGTPRSDRRRWWMVASLAAGMLLGVFLVYLWFTIPSSDDFEIVEDPQPPAPLERSGPPPRPRVDPSSNAPQDP